MSTMRRTIIGKMSWKIKIKMTFTSPLFHALRPYLVKAETLYEVTRHDMTRAWDKDIMINMARSSQVSKVVEVLSKVLQTKKGLSASKQVKSLGKAKYAGYISSKQNEEKSIGTPSIVLLC